MRQKIQKEIVIFMKNFIEFHKLSMMLHLLKTLLWGTL